MIIHQHILIYKYVFISRSGFDCDKMENVEFINLEELYNGRIDM
nr:MAG TPA: hypothetical protein [Caudoviricetes sp.]